MSLISIHLLWRMTALQWRHNDHDGVSNHQPRDCLLNRLFRRRSTKTSKLRVTGLCEGNSPVTGEFPAQRSSNAENVSIWWRHHECAWLAYTYCGVWRYAAPTTLVQTRDCCRMDIKIKPEPMDLIRKKTVVRLNWFITMSYHQNSNEMFPVLWYFIS